MKDYIIRGISKNKNIKIAVVKTTNIIETSRLIHGTSPTSTAAMGRVLTAGILMANELKNKNDVLTLSIAGNGPAKGIHVVVKKDGTIKGYMGNPKADIPSNEDGTLNVGGLVGNQGTLTTIIDLGLREPYIGKSEIITGEIGDDIANYYAVSKQQPSAIGLGVLVDKDISVKSAGGFLVELMPGISEEDIDILESNLNKIEPISKMIDKDMSPEDIAKEILRGFDLNILEKEEIQYNCDCSRNKVEKALISIGGKEIHKILSEDGSAEMECHFCNSKYIFSEKDLEKILLTIKGK